uniref:Neurotransmitter-gated ion-channel ligand-binding domain-containing protein n=1 Tax=Anolis carolinensis TaxID=28377 RepID=A0A803TLW9_ANOCA
MFWVPEIFIDERADENKYTASTHLSINSTGQITFFQSYRLTSSCNLDVHAFPFDKQKCNLTLTVSVYPDENILLKSAKTSKAANQDSHIYYMSNGEWKFEELRTINRYVSYGSLNCSAVIYEITMSRRSIFYVLVVIIPMFALFLLDMAISYAFGTPGEKVAFKVTLILQVTFLSLILTDKLPATSDDPPIIAKFFTGMFVLLIFGILENAFELYLREKKPKFSSLVTCVNRFKRKEKKESEDAVTYLGKQ